MLSQKKNLKIGIFVDNFFPMIDGVVMVVDNYAKRLSKHAEVVVVAPSYGTKNDQQIAFPYKVIRVNSLKIPIINYNLALPILNVNLKAELMAQHFDLIHIHSPFSLGKLGVNIAHQMNIPIIGTMHSQFKKDFLRYVKFEYLATKLTNKIVKTFNECDECWAVNQKIAELFQIYGYYGRPLVMANATDMTIIEDKFIANTIVNQKYGLDEKDIIFLFVGRINILKNILFIVEVLRCLKKKKINFKMLFVGNGNDLELLKSKVTEYNLNNNVIYCGKINNRQLLTSIYARSKLFIFPSLYDASSLVQIEAASQKIPTIFLEGAITASTVKNNINGFIAPNNVQNFANTIIKILANKKLYDKVSEKAYKDIYKHYDKMTQKIFKRYFYLIKKRWKNEKIKKK